MTHKFDIDPVRLPWGAGTEAAAAAHGKQNAKD